MMNTVKCHGCSFFYITYKQLKPYGCKAYGFISKTLPAKVVFDSDLKLTMVGWDNSYKYAMLKEDEIGQLKSLNTKLADFSVDIQRVLINLTKEWYDFYGFDLPDPITMAIALDNSLIEESQDLHVMVDTRDGITRGQTIVDYFDIEDKKKNVRVVTKSSNDKFMNMLLDLLS